MKISEYFNKMKGSTRGSPPRVSNQEIWWSWIGAFLGITAVALLVIKLLNSPVAPAILAGLLPIVLLVVMFFIYRAFFLKK